MHARKREERDVPYDGRSYIRQTARRGARQVKLEGRLIDSDQAVKQP